MYHEHQQDSPLHLQDPLYQQQLFRCYRYQSTYQICLYPPPIGHRLQQMANDVDVNDALTMPHGLPPSQVPLIYTSTLAMDGNRAYSTAGSTASMPTSAFSTYNYNHPQAPHTGAQSTTSNALLERHMSQLSRTMIQLTQANQLIANTQKQIQQAMINAQKHQVDAFNALVHAERYQKLVAFGSINIYNNNTEMHPRFLCY